MFLKQKPFFLNFKSEFFRLNSTSTQPNSPSQVESKSSKSKQKRVVLVIAIYFVNLMDEKRISLSDSYIHNTIHIHLNCNRNPPSYYFNALRVKRCRWCGLVAHVDFCLESEYYCSVSVALLKSLCQIVLKDWARARKKLVLMTYLRLRSRRYFIMKMSNNND